MTRLHRERLMVRLITLAIFIQVLFSATAQSASFDCTKAGTSVEKMICEDEKISKLDEYLSETYTKALKLAPDPQLLKQKQRNWLKKRNQCDITECILVLYIERIKELDQVIKTRVENKSNKKRDVSIQYVPEMSKNDAVCQHMLAIYNNDLRKYGKIRYTDHEEFKAIEWEEKKYYTTYPDGKKHNLDPRYGKAFMSTFDINNDGHEEVVLKFNELFKRQFADRMYYFDAISSGDFSGEIDVNGLSLKATGKMGTFVFPHNAYELKENYKVLAGWFYINPFRLDDSYYIDMYDDYSDEDKWRVVLKYTDDNKLNDICYYSMATGLKKTK